MCEYEDSNICLNWILGNSTTQEQQKSSKEVEIRDAVENFVVAAEKVYVQVLPLNSTFR